MLVGFHERKSSYVADIRSCDVLPPHVSDMLLPLRELIGAMEARDRLPQIELAVGDDVDGAGAAPPRAADRGATWRGCAPSRATHGVAVVAAAQGAGHGAPARRGRRRAWPTRCPSSASTMPFKPTDFTQVNPHINRVLVSRALRLLDARAGRAGDRLVLRPRQLHPAAGDAGARGAGHRGQRGAGRARPRRLRSAQRSRPSARRVRGAQPVRDDAGRPAALRRGRHAGWSIRRARARSRSPRRWPTCTEQPRCAGLDAAAAHRLRQLQPGDAGARRRAAGAPGRLPLQRGRRGQHVPAHGARGEHGGLRPARAIEKNKAPTGPC